MQPQSMTGLDVSSSLGEEKIYLPLYIFRISPSTFLQEEDSTFLPALCMYVPCLFFCAFVWEIREATPGRETDPRPPSGFSFQGFCSLTRKSFCLCYNHFHHPVFPVFGEWAGFIQVLGATAWQSVGRT
jgi:hypothetical protein